MRQGLVRRESGAARSLLHVAGALAVSAALCAVPAAPARAAGDPASGQALFTEKQCARCHVPRGFQAPGPPLEVLQRPQGEMELAARLWNHLPSMAVALGQSGFEWPSISERQMVDLMAFLQADPRRDPPPDFRKGQLLVLRKGCLKCHSLRGEGGRVKPDLADHRKDYESAAAWAATMWKHTPAMASMSASMGLQYPRFDEDEMGQLVGFLRRSGEMAPPKR